MRIIISALLFVVFCSSLLSAQLLVGDRATNQVTKHDPLTGEFQGVLIGGDPTTNGGLIAPSAMTLGPNNELWVSSFIGSVLRYDSSTGDFLGTFAEGLNGPAGLLYNADQDEMFVSTLGNFDSELILRYQASTGELLSTLGEGTGESGRTGLGFGPDGNLYVSSFANGDFFTGAVLQFDGQSLTPTGSFALEPFLSGASSFTFREGETEDTYQLDLVGLFSNNVARFDIGETDGKLAVQNQGLLITEDLDFPSALIDLGDGSMIVTNLGNDNPQTGDLRPGSIARFDIASGDFLNTFLPAGGEAGTAQPAALVLLPSSGGLDFNGDGNVDVMDLAGSCSAGVSQRDALLNQLGLLTGDFDADGEVGFVDFLILSKAFGTEAGYSSGDVDCSGTVDFADFLAFSANFGEMTVATQSVPEPAAHVLILLGLMTLQMRRRYP